MAWKGITFFPPDANFPFIKLRDICVGLSFLAMLGSLVLFMTRGLNYGIDFKGGTLIEIGTKGPANLGELRDKLGSLGLGEVQIQGFGKPEDVLIRLETQAGGEAAQQAAVEKVRGALGDSVDYRRVEVVGPTVSSELRQTGIIAVSIAILMIGAYIWFRFEWQFAVGAIVALLHDALTTIGIFSLLQMEFDISVVAALLTIVGYSINDTVVVSDRIRENLRKYRKMPLAELLNRSINETLSRTIITSGTTMIAIIALYFLGGEVIRGFNFAMMWGVFVGTYSSIFIAAPILQYLGIKRDWSGTGGGEAKAKEPAGSKAKA